MLFGPGGSPLITPYFPGNLRLGASLGKPSSTEVAVTLVWWEVFCPGLPLSHQLQLRYAQAVSWDEEGVMPAMDVGMGARPPLLRRSVQVAPSQLQRGEPREDMFMKTEVHQVILIIWNRTSLEETTDQLLLETWYSSPPDVPPLRYQQLCEADRAVLTYTCWKTGTFVSSLEQLRFRENQKHCKTKPACPFPEWCWYFWYFTLIQWYLTEGFLSSPIGIINVLQEDEVHHFYLKNTKADINT